MLSGAQIGRRTFPAKWEGQGLGWLYDAGSVLLRETRCPCHDGHGPLPVLEQQTFKILLIL